MDSDDWQEIESKQETSQTSESDENGQNETWTVLRSSNSGQLLREVCSSEHSVHEELFTVQDLLKIRKQLLDSFDSQFTFIAERLVNLDTTNSSESSLASSFSAAAAALHEQQQTFDFTAAYILKLCADYLQKSFHLVLKDILTNKDKHKKEYSNFLQEAAIEIIAAGMLDDHDRMEQLITGHRVCQNSLRQTQFNHKMNSIINASDKINDKTLNNSSQQEDLSAKEFSFQVLKLKLQMKCQLYLESWQTIMELLGYYKSQSNQNQLNQLKIECENAINQKQNPLEMFILKSVSLQIPEIMVELQKLDLNENQKIALLARVLAFRPVITLSEKKQTSQINSKNIPNNTDSHLDDDSFPRLSYIQHHTTNKHKEVSTKKINCLSLDGGGIRGVVQLILLSELENKTGKKCCEMFDFFGGTSIGGIIALSLAAGYSAQTLLFKFIGTTKNHIFAQRHYMRYLLGVNPDGQESQFNYALYDKEGIETELKEFFKDMKLNELPNNVLVTSCEIKGTEMVPVVFTKLGDESGKRSIQGLHPSKNMDTQFASALLRDVARSSSAAYPFLSATVINGSAFVDGGFLFNNVDILVTNFLISQGYKKSQIKMLSLGNAPPEIASSMMGLEQGRTAALGLINCVKGLANPENYYESYIAMANLNLDHSLAETSAALGGGYVRISPEYGGQFISLDAVDAEDVSKLKSIGSNWINTCRKNGHFKEIQKNILNQFDWISNEVDDIQIIPRYYSYTEEYLGLESAISAKEETIWRKNLLGFQFRDKQQIVEPYSISKMFKGFFVASKIDEQAELLSKAAAIGHIPSLKYLLSPLSQNQQRELILKQTHNYWNSMHYAAANGEIASFVYLLGVLFETDLFSESNNDIIPKRIRKSISTINWEQTKQNIKDFIAEKSTTQLPYSNCYAPLFNYHRVDTLMLALENKQLQFNEVLKYLLAD